MNKLVKKGLGRGLAALISTPPVPTDKELFSQMAKEFGLPPTAYADKERALAAGEKSTPTEAPQDDKIINIKEHTASMPAATAPAPEAKSSRSLGDNPNAVLYIKTSELRPNPKQPRTDFSEKEIAELAESLKQLGLIQPILVRPDRENKVKFEIVAGERRWRASQKAGLPEVPVIVKHLSDRETLEIALVENVQRANLNPMEEAVAYQRLCDEFSLSQEEVAARVGKERTTVANLIRLLKLPESVQKMVREQELSLGHGKVIASVREPQVQIHLAKRVKDESLSVRALEAIVGREVSFNPPRTKKKQLKSGQHAEVTESLQRTLGTKVALRESAKGKGIIVIEYYSVEERERLVDQIVNGSALNGSPKSDAKLGNG